ncbi:serine hydrolase FSH [Cercophora newfieldiana]|uniref:Serine hydrolase FSH n=1 Tax=Cercophora newfieldiana TaxID=92897 RepID=A0AA39YC15_9PEZI|nr:serine hydrolase FSH [Cercophora newfieldiana]
MPSTPDPTLALPRILCLHGGGVNGKVFQLQCRGLLAGELSKHFRFVFINGPFVCAPHGAIGTVYGDFAPFYRWLRWEPEHEELDARLAALELLDHCNDQMNADEGTGPWVGVLGFSQGAKMAANFLWMQERLNGPVPMLASDVRFRFGVFMAGSAPPVMLDPHGVLQPVPRHIDTADTLGTSVFTDWPESNEGEHSIAAPTLHVHGLRDPGIEGHRKLFRWYVKPGTAKLVEWDGDHRIPLKKSDVQPVVDGILDMARQTGVL